MSRRIYTDGIFDLFHFGHALHFKQIKDRFPGAVLVVGVCNDELTLKHKGKTVMSSDERYESLRHCKYVDEVIENAPWVVTPEFLKLHRLDFIAHDPAPYYHPETGEDIYEWAKSSGRFISINRTEGISTSEIIQRILSKSKTYIERNRARGFTLQEI